MKYILVLFVGFFITGKNEAQNFSCSGAAQYNANYSKAIQPLENVSITLQQGKAMVKETTAKTNSSNSFYAITGTTSTAQFTSLAANIGFSTCSKMPSFELYKTEVKNGMRTFTIPAGINGSNAVNIPIQVITPPALQNPNRNGAIVWGQGNFKIKFTNGYLSAGEYVLIDKDSLTPDGTQLKGVAFTIK